MKKIFILLVSVFSVVLYGGTILNAGEPSKPITTPSKNPQTGTPSGTKEIPLDKHTKHGGMNDRQSRADVMAYANGTSGSVDIYLYDAGLTDVYIINSKNEVVFEDSYDSFSFPLISVSIPKISGKYWVVIDSDYIYADGQFLL